MAHKVVHWELMGSNGTELRNFYAELFGWDPQPLEAVEDYFFISGDETGIGGAIGTGPERMPSYQTIYVGVPDVDAHLAKAEAAGGKVVVSKQTIPEVVTFGIFSDPAGNLVGVVEETE